MRTIVDLDLPVLLDRSSGRSLQQQLADALRTAALDGHLPAGMRLPSTRRLASQLAIARVTAVAAYEQLSGEGYLEAGHGSGTFIAPGIGTRRVPEPCEVPPPVITASNVLVDLRPGRPDTRRLIDPAWRAAWRAATGGAVASSEPPTQGLPELRMQIAEHLRVARGIAADPDDVFVAAGTSEALALIVHALGLRGRGVAVEDPGYPAAQRLLNRFGCVLYPVPVDAGGLRVDDLSRARTPAAAVLVTPSHQYPLGATLGIERRQSLLEYARRHRAIVIEDDYDSEFRYGAAPLPALATLDPQIVIHAGTFSKTVTPWLRLGFVLAPPQLRPALREVRADMPAPVSGFDQQALASYMATGALHRHIARSRRDYHHRRAHLHRLLDAAPALTSTDSRAGLHTVIRLPPGTDVPHLLDRLLERDIALSNLTDYLVDATSPYPALVLGFGDATTTDLNRVVTALHDLLKRTTDATTGRAREAETNPSS